MDTNYGDYLKQVADLGGANSKKPLQDFYNINGALIRFFGMINTQVEHWLQNQNLDDNAIDQILSTLKQHKPTLAQLKFEASQTDVSDYEGNTRSKLEKQLAYIKNEMVLEEADLVLQNLKQLKTTPKTELKPKTPKNDSNFLLTFLKTEYGEGYTYEGDLLNNLPQGNGALYYPNKQLYAIGEWAKGRLQNTAKVYYDNGWLWQDGLFMDGKLHGNGKEFYYHLNKEHGFYNESSYEGEYKAGKLIGNGRVFLDSYLKLDGKFEHNNKVTNAKVTFDQGEESRMDEWFEGTIDILNKSEGLFIGEGTNYRVFDDENIKYTSVGKFKISLSIEWPQIFGTGKIYRNQILNAEGFFKNGYLKNGKTYDNDGSIFFEGEFQLNEKGYDEPKKGKKYYEGKVSSVGEFKDYALHGYGEDYFKNGQLHQKGYFVKGKLDSKGIKYFSNGKVSEEGTFRNGELHGGGKKYYYDNGVLFEDGIFNDGKLHGKGVRYDYGVLRVLEQGNFINGEFHGK